MPEIEGMIEDIVFRNDANEWTVLTVRAGREHVTCVGVLPQFAPGERLKLTGEWAEHRDYGKQLKITAFESVRPTTVNGIERYLGSGIIRGIGPATAKQIVQHFGAEALDVLDDEPERLTEIAGIGPKRAQMIAESYMAQRKTRLTMVFLQSYGLSPALSTKVIKALGDRTEQLVRANPYVLAEKVEGVGFRTADNIAMALGIEKESEHRILAGVLFALDDAVHVSGHMYLPRGLLIDRARGLLSVDASMIERAITQQVLSGALIMREIAGEIAVYPRKLYEAEGEVAQRLAARAMATLKKGALPDAEARVAAFERESGVSFHAAQREAVLRAVGGAVTIITGGPGTGKTTCIHCMLKLLEGLGTTQLAAPTGRAAKRMTEATGAAAQTIHRLLEYGGDGEDFQRDENNPLELSALIVDEVSMVDIFLMRALLRALPNNARLILVGDADQLPSVGAGNVLRDMIDSGVLPVVRLTEIFRQAESSDIVLNAHRINRGEMPVANKRGTDFFFERADSPAAAVEAVVNLCASRLPAFLGVDPLRGIQVMSPMKKGDAGVWALNRRLQAALNPPAPDKIEMHLHDNLIREGDKVMQVRNNYDLHWTRGDEQGDGAFNGDIGFATAIDLEERTVEVTFDDDRVSVYADSDLDDLEIAYCMSVHKSQGSEFEAVVLPLVSGPPMLMTRNLLYTAVTRARRLAVLVGREACVESMVNNNYITRRFSALMARLRTFAQTGSE